MNQELWVVFADGKEFKTDFETLRTWIAEGRVKMTDKVRTQGGPWVVVSSVPKLKMLVLTGDIHCKYEVLDSIFAVDSSTETLFHGVNPSAAFDGVKFQLRRSCRALGGDAVIFCQFQYRNSIDTTLINRQSLEIFAYGTAVRILPNS